ncbi:winged helix-turn-helix domain-containing protein [Streptomyces sp. NPDC046942]|uniref:winged helix-turn-helix domain-containing protein n=1 Tax=Streptomyces sp. NPDC046942 TaxID=3155137 RepID=UPI0033DCF79A
MSHRVAVLALDRVLPLDLGIPARVFNEARDPVGTPLYSVVTCSLGGQPVRTHEDYRLVVDHDESVLESADTVVLATQEPGEHLRPARPPRNSPRRWTQSSCRGQGGITRTRTQGRTHVQLPSAGHGLWIASKGPASYPKLSPVQFARLQTALAEVPAAHGWADQRWTLVRVKLLIGRMFRVSYTVRGVRGCCGARLVLAGARAAGGGAG